MSTSQKQKPNQPAVPPPRGHPGERPLEQVVSGGHALDTGEGPVLLEHPVGRGVESPATIAWRAYVEHTHGPCQDCRPTSQNCPTANGLWSAYTDTRHASEPAP